MKNILYKSIVFMSSLTFSLSLYAQTGVNSGTGPTTNRTTTNTTAGSAANADKEAKRQQVGQITTSILSGVFVATGTAKIASQNYAEGAMYIGMGIVTSIQSANYGKSKGVSKSALCDTASGLNCNDFDMGDVPGAGGGNNASNLHNIKRDLENVGVNFNDKDKSFTVKNKTYKPSDFSSPMAMKAAGFSDDLINSSMKEAQKLGAEAYEKAVNSVTGVGEQDGGGGGGGGSGSSSASNTDVEYDPNAEALRNALAKDKIERNPAALAQGMSKYFGSDRIGVAGDSLFDMMNRRYNLKDKEGFFYKLGEGATSQK